jgi:hypothetical protein
MLRLTRDDDRSGAAANASPCALERKRFPKAILSFATAVNQTGINLSWFLRLLALRVISESTAFGATADVRRNSPCLEWPRTDIGCLAASSGHWGRYKVLVCDHPVGSRSVPTRALGTRLVPKIFRFALPRLASEVRRPPPGGGSHMRSSTTDSAWREAPLPRLWADRPQARGSLPTRRSDGPQPSGGAFIRCCSFAACHAPE